MRLISPAVLVLTQLFAGAALAEDTFTIDIPSQAFVPAQAVVPEGTTVTWTNTSTMIHTVTFDPALARDPASALLPEGATAFDSGAVRAGQTFVKTFAVPGAYTYFCRPHELMGHVGTLIVTAAAPRVAIADAPAANRLADVHVATGTEIVWSNAATVNIALAVMFVPPNASVGIDVIPATDVVAGTDFAWAPATAGTYIVSVTYADGRALTQNVTAWDL